MGAGERVGYGKRVKQRKRDRRRYSYFMGMQEEAFCILILNQDKGTGT